MKKNILTFIFILATALCAQEKPSAEGVEGYWVIKENGQPTSILGAYVHKDNLYVKILVSFDPKDPTRYATIENPIKMETLKGSPFLQGLDIVWGGSKSFDEKKGTSCWAEARVLEPKKAKLFGGTIYKEKGVLVLRGNSLAFPMFKKTVIWYPLEEKDIPKGYRLPRLDTLTPNLCKEYLQ